MQILIDECLPKKLKRELVDYTVSTVPEEGWAGLKNGELLCVAENEFDVWITADRSVEYQQNLSLFEIAVVVLGAPSNQCLYRKLVLNPTQYVGWVEPKSIENTKH